MKKTVYTEEELRAFIMGCVGQTPNEKDGYMYAGWYLANGRKLIDEWFYKRYGRDYTDMDLEAHMDEIGEYVCNKYNEWIETV